MKWETARLADKCLAITKGTTPTTLGMSYSDSGIPFIRVNNFREGVLRVNSNILFISQKTQRTLSRSIIKGGDVLLSIAGTIGRSCVVPGNSPDANCNQAVCVVRVDKAQIDHRFLQRWFCCDSAFSQFSDGKVSGVISNLSLTHVRNLQVPLPPLPEQKRIAEILDKADALRAKRRESIAKLDELLQATFLDMFGDPVTNPKGWDVVVVGDLLMAANYGTSKKADSEDGEYPILRMNNITYSGAWNFGDLKYIDLDEKDLPKHLVHRGQILFNRTNSKELVGKTAVYRKEEPMAFAGYLVRGVVSASADPEYIGAFMNTPQTKQYLRNKCKSIVGMANINAKEFQAIPIQ
jgi:type I restriction enzyme, S subunit